MANKYNGDVTKDGTKVKMYDKQGNALEDGYAVNGVTYKSNGDRIDVGTNVQANDGKIYTYNGEGKASTVHDPNAVATGGVSVNNGANSSNENVGQKSSKESIVDDYVKAQKQAQVAALQNGYNNVINQIAQQEKATKDTATANRNNASVQNQLANQRVANFMANNGLTNSGTNAQMYMNSQGALQNSLGNITTAEQDALSRLGDQRVLAKQNLENDIASANAGLDATKLQYQLAQLDSDDEYKRQLELLAIQNGYDMDKLNTQLDYQYIWDDTLGRRVPFETYMYTHPQIMANYQNAMPKTTTGGGSTGSGSGSMTMKDAVTAYNNYLKNAGLTMEDLPFETWYNVMFNGGSLGGVEEEPDLGAYIKNGDDTDKAPGSSTPALTKIVGAVTSGVKDTAKNAVKNKVEDVTQSIPVQNGIKLVNGVYNLGKWINDLRK